MPHFFPWWPLWKTCSWWGKRTGETESRMFCNCTGQSAFAEWFPAHPRMVPLFLPPFSSFSHRIYFPHGGGVYIHDHQPHDQMSLLDSMNAGCLVLSAEDCLEWIMHANRSFPRCLERQAIRFDQNAGLTSIVVFLHFLSYAIMYSEYSFVLHYWNHFS